MGMFGDLDNLNKQQQADAIEQKVKTKLQVTSRKPVSRTPVESSPFLAEPPKTPKPNNAKSERAAGQPQVDDIVTPSEISAISSVARSTVRSSERTKIRHSFDIFSDQLFALRDLAYDRQRGSVKKVPLGDLVQEALDLYLAAQQQSR
jgi:hypothetical protein